MSKGEKVLITILAVGFIVTNAVIATVVQPVTKTVTKVQYQMVTPTASPSATIIPTRVLRGVSVTKPVTPTTAVKSVVK